MLLCLLKSVCFEVCELCSSHSFRLTDIRSKPWVGPWNVFFFRLSFGSHDRSFDPSVVNEQPVLVMGAFSFGIAAFLETTSLGASFSCLVILAFVPDEYSTPAGPSDSSNFSFLSLIRLWTLRLSALQFSTE